MKQASKILHVHVQEIAFMMYAASSLQPAKQKQLTNGPAAAASGLGRLRGGGKN
jgi:hypothetical protein